MDETEKRNQVADQYKVVAHLATALAGVHSDMEKVIRDGHMGNAMLDLQGNRSAALMEMLGNFLNGMDAVDEGEDAWVNPIFRAAHKMFPQETKP